MNFKGKGIRSRRNIRFNQASKSSQKLLSFSETKMNNYKNDLVFTDPITVTAGKLRNFMRLKPRFRGQMTLTTY